VVKNKRECQQGVTSKLRAQQCWNHGKQTLWGHEEPTTDRCWKSVEDSGGKLAERSWDCYEWKQTMNKTDVNWWQLQQFSTNQNIYHSTLRKQQIKKSRILQRKTITVNKSENKACYNTYWLFIFFNCKEKQNNVYINERRFKMTRIVNTSEQLSTNSAAYS